MSSPFPHLPLVSFDSRSLRLIDFSPAAARIFGRDWTKGKSTRIECTAGDLLVRSKEDEGCEVALGRIKQNLGYLSNETEQLAWGQSVVLEYYVDRGGAEKEELKADVLVSYEKGVDKTNGQDCEGLYTIIFLRPHDGNNLATELPPNSPPFQATISTTSKTSTLSSPPLLSPPAPHEPGTAVIPTSYIEQLLTATGTEPTQDNNNEELAKSTSTGSIRSASFSSSRRSARPTVGKDREKLPLSPDFAILLSHATAQVTDDSEPPPRTRSMPSYPRSKPTTLRPMSPVKAPSNPASQSLPNSNVASPLNTSFDPSSIHSASDLPSSIPVPSSTLSPSSHETLDSATGSIGNGVREQDFGSPKMDQCSRAESHDVYDGKVSEEVMQGIHSIFPHSPTEDSSVPDSSKESAVFDSPDQSASVSSDAGSTTPLSPSGASRTPLTLEELTDLVEVQPQICFIADREGQVKWLNDAWYRYTGLDNRYHLSFEKWMSLFHPDDLPSALKIYIAAMQSGDSFKMEYRIKNKDGELRWMVCHGRAAKDAEGKPVGWFCSITDVEELVQTRHEALLIQERIKAVLEGSRTFLLSIDTEMRITFFEGSLDAPTSISPKAQEALLGKDLSDFLHDSELLEAARKIIDEEETEIGMLREIVGPDGTISWARFRLVPLVGDPSIPETAPDAKAVHGVIIVGADVTEVITTENELQKTRSEQVELESREKVAQEANRLKTEFLTTMSHELRSPIAQIMGVMELVLADNTLADDHRRLIGKAVGSGEVLLDLIGAVLDVRKVEAGELTLETQPFLLSQVIEDARLFSVTAQAKGLHFEEDIGEYYEGTVLGDRLRLRQILTNALSNAVKFTPSGSITLRIRQAEESDSSIRLEIEVEDTGVGIEESVLPTLFQPFRQANSGTARQFGGTGLGLVIAKKLVELMKGSVVLNSKYGKGTKFTISLSLAKAPLLDVKDFVGSKHLVPPTSAAEAIKLQHTEKAVAAHRERRRPEDVRVLLAEDNALIREIVTRTLRGMKFNVDAVEDGYQCLAKLEEEQYDVILMDGQMPGLDGYQTSRAIREDPKLRDIRIIALTASAIAGDRERCLEAGMSTYLAKPVRANDLQRTIFEQVELLDAEKTPPVNGH